MNSFQGVINLKCPRCRTGDMFKYPVTKISRFNIMHKNCSCCELTYAVEPGFFIGAMYISYAAAVFQIFVIGFTLYIFFEDAGLWVYGLSVGFTTLIFSPVIFRFSRVLYLFWFGGIKYDPSIKLKNC